MNPESNTNEKPFHSTYSALCKRNSEIAKSITNFAQNDIYETQTILTNSEKKFWKNTRKFDTSFSFKYFRFH